MEAASLVVVPGAIVTFDKSAYCVMRLDAVDSVVGRDIETGTDRTIKLSDLSSIPELGSDKTRTDLIALANDRYGSDQWDIACERYRIIRPLLGIDPSRALIESTAAEHDTSVASLYRWIRAYRESGLVTSLMRKKRKDAGTKKIDPRAEKVIRRVLVKLFLKSQKLKMRKAYRQVERLCRRGNIPVPHFNTFVQRVEELSPELKAKKRHGDNAALAFRARRGSFPAADAPYAVLQIDHTSCDVVLVDEVDRIPIGRPWITLAIHVQSRVVAGWYVSFDPPGTLGTGLCIANAVLPKEPLMASLGVEYPWPFQGLVSIIHADNAKEFRGNTLRVACQEWGMDLQFRKVKKPHYGGHIERYLGTLLDEIHTLAGTTFSSPKDRKNYNSEDKAVMTLREFEEWLANLILGNYHHHLHSELGMSPLQRYRELVLGSDDRPGMGVLPVVTDAEKLRIDFLPFEDRTIQTYGTQIDGIEYYADVLRVWVAAPDPKRKRAKRKFIFRRDPRDLSYVLFWDPNATRYFRIPYRDLKRPRMSLWELRAVNRFLAKEGKKNVDEDTIFEAFDRMREIEKSATKETRRMRLERERRRHHRAARPLLPEDTATRDLEPPPPYDPSKITPFAEVEDA